MVWRCATSSTAQNDDFLWLTRFLSLPVRVQQSSPCPGPMFQFLGQTCIISGHWIDSFQMTSLHNVRKSRILVNHGQTISLKPVLSLPLSCDYKLCNIHFESFWTVSLRFHPPLASPTYPALHALTQGAKSYQPSRRQAWLGGLTWSGGQFFFMSVNVGHKFCSLKAPGSKENFWGYTPPFEIYSFYNLLEGWTLFWAVCSFLVQDHGDHFWQRHTVTIQETPQDVEELPQFLSEAPWYDERRQQRLTPLKCYALDRNEVGFSLQEHNPSSLLFAFGVLRILWQNTPHH